MIIYPPAITRTTALSFRIYGISFISLRFSCSPENEVATVMEVMSDPAPKL